MEFIGKKVTIGVKFIVGTSVKTEYIQGIITENKSDSYIVKQCIPFPNCFDNIGEFHTIERVVFKNSIRGDVIIEG